MCLKNFTAIKVSHIAEIVTNNYQARFLTLKQNKMAQEFALSYECVFGCLYSVLIVTYARERK